MFKDKKCARRRLLQTPPSAFGVPSAYIKDGVNYTFYVYECSSTLVGVDCDACIMSINPNTIDYGRFALDSPIVVSGATPNTNISIVTAACADYELSDTEKCSYCFLSENSRGVINMMLYSLGTMSILSYTVLLH